jgi:hypothetical protein
MGINTAGKAGVADFTMLQPTSHDDTFTFYLKYFKASVNLNSERECFGFHYNDKQNRMLFRAASK